VPIVNSLNPCDLQGLDSLQALLPQGHRIDREPDRTTHSPIGFTRVTPLNNPGSTLVS
jgi:hypothetical protein